MAREIDSVQTSSDLNRIIVFEGINPLKRYFVQCAIITEKKGKYSMMNQI